MKVLNGEKPPVANSSRSHRLRMVILMLGSCALRASRSARSLPSTTRFTSFPPYGAISFAFDIQFSVNLELLANALPTLRPARREAELYFKIQSMNFRLPTQFVRKKCVATNQKKRFFGRKGATHLNNVPTL